MNDLVVNRKRPYSVSLLLFVLIVCFMVGASRLVTAFSSSDLLGIFLLPYLLLLLLTFLTVLKRRPVGRTLGGTVLMLLLAAVIYYIFNDPDHAAKPELLQPSNAAQRGGALLSRLLLIPLIGFWFYRFVFSRGTKEYFGVK